MPVSVSCDWCGAELHRSPSNVFRRNFCDRACHGKYRSAHLTGTNAAHWKGGRKLDRGRVMFYRPDHPHAQQEGYVYRYRLILEEVIGRFLRLDEIVHHIDGDETNDHPENLMAMSQSEHASSYDARRRRQDAAL